MAGPENSNTLGAPAEGFGQNVTFAFNPNPRGLSEAQAAGVDLVRAGASGQPIGGEGFTAGDMRKVPEARMDPALTGLFKAADAMLNKNIEEGKRKNFFIGMQRAQQGAAVADIVAEQPAWSRFFGESDTAQGARAWTQNAKVAETVAGWETSMPDLRKMTGPEAQRWLNDSITKSMTGDPATDAAMMEGFARHAPQFLKNQVKANYSWQQEVAASAHGASTYGELALFDTQARNIMGRSDAAGAEELEASTARLTTALVPADGQNLDTWRGNLLASMARAGENGQVFGIRAAIRGLQESGGDAVFGNEAMVRASNFLQAAERNIAQQFRQGPEFLGFMQNLESLERDGKLTVDGAAQLLTVFDAESRNKLGLGMEPVIHNQEILRTQNSVRAMLEAAQRENLKALLKQGTAVDKAQQETVNRDASWNAFITGQISSMRTAEDWTVAKTDAANWERLQQSGLLEPGGEDTPATQTARKAVHLHSTSASGTPNPHMKEVLGASWATSLASNDAGLLATEHNRAAKLVKGLPSDQAYLVLKDYYGEDGAGRLTNMLTQSRYTPMTGVPNLGVLQAAQQAPKPLRSYPEKIQKLAKERVEEITPTLFGALGGNASREATEVELNDASKEQATAGIARRIASSSAPNEAAAKLSASRDFFALDAQVMGSRLIMHPRKAGEPGVMDMITQDLNKQGIAAAGSTLQLLTDKAINRLTKAGSNTKLQAAFISGRLVFVDPETFQTTTLTPGEIVAEIAKEDKLRQEAFKKPFVPRLQPGSKV